MTAHSWQKHYDKKYQYSLRLFLLLTFISAYLAEYPEWRMIIYSITLIVLMLRRPQGLFGNKELSLKMFHLGGGKDGSTAESK